MCKGIIYENGKPKSSSCNWTIYILFLGVGFFSWI